MWLPLIVTVTELEAIALEPRPCIVVGLTHAAS